MTSTFLYSLSLQFFKLHFNRSASCWLLYAFKRIFNLEVNSDNDGCLQDIHWYSGDFGYFPTYLIGAIIAAQLKKTIEDDIPNISSSIESGNFKIITKWLNKNIHSFGNSITVNDLLLKISGQKLKSKFYKNHLENRYLN